MSKHLIGITEPKDGDFSEWYSQVITKGELIDYYDISGCYILRESTSAIWREIQNYFNKILKDEGVKEVYFPLFVTRNN